MLYRCAGDLKGCVSSQDDRPEVFEAPWVLPDAASASALARFYEHLIIFIIVIIILITHINKHTTTLQNCTIYHNNMNPYIIQNLCYMELLSRGQGTQKDPTADVTQQMAQLKRAVRKAGGQSIRIGEDGRML